MDNVSSLECLKLDSQLEVLDKDAAMVPLNCDTPIIETMTEEPETTEPTEEERIAHFWRKTEESEDEESEDEESMDWKSKDKEPEDDESDDWKSEVEESDDEKSKDGKSYGECKYCLKVDKHPTQLCSYRYRVPKNAIVGESCVVACLECTICGKEEEHSNFECPEREEKRKNSGFTYDPYTGSFEIRLLK
ncbi:unnamed protein product [Prunus armeniaca]|uniref:Nanos-type domain-containing protein n=1 Tax=Prunus armeniaca TaxID=36596 RepID=A0A6J5VA96_PRUAR|nr:unnamed protein product [Prunus armeniaca]